MRELFEEAAKGGTVPGTGCCMGRCMGTPRFGWWLVFGKGTCSIFQSETIVVRFHLEPDPKGLLLDAANGSTGTCGGPDAELFAAGKCCARSRDLSRRDKTNLMVCVVSSQ